MSGGKDSQGVYASALAGSWTRGEIQTNQDLVDAFAARVDVSTERGETALRQLNQYAVAFDRVDEDMMDKQRVRDLVRTVTNEATADGFSEQNVHRLQGLVGLVDHSTEANGGDDILTDFVTREGYSLYLIGGTGDGKNNTASKMAERFKDSKGGPVITNVHSFSGNDYYTDNMERLKEIGRETDEWCFVILDEASNWGTGQPGDVHLANRLGKLLKYARKDRYKMNIVFIGHDGKDLVPSARETVDHVAKMEPRNYGNGDTRPGKMKVGRKIKEREIRDEIDPSPIGGIGETFFEYDDGESSYFYLHEDLEDRVRARLENPDIEYTQRQMADAEGVSLGKIQNIVQSVQMEDKTA